MSNKMALSSSLLYLTETYKSSINSIKYLKMRFKLIVCL